MFALKFTIINTNAGRELSQMSCKLIHCEIQTNARCFQPNKVKEGRTGMFLYLLDHVITELLKL